MMPKSDTAVPSTDDAVTASVACAAALGLPVDTAEVVATGYSVRVLLQPAGVLSRVMTTGQLLRGNPIPWLRREVEVAGFLAARRAAVAPPFASPGPHHASGLDVTLWTYLEAQSAGVSQEEFAQLLFELHGQLDHYPKELPFLAGPIADIETALSVSDDATLHRAAARLLPEAQGWPRHVVHGDAHVGNLLGTKQGLRWIDFEDACLGPREWDFASLTIDRDAVAGYPGDLDPARIGRCRQLRRLQILASMLVTGPDSHNELLHRTLAEALSPEVD